MTTTLSDSQKRELQRQIDVMTAYLNGAEIDYIYLKFPRGHGARWCRFEDRDKKLHSWFNWTDFNYHVRGNGEHDEASD